MGQSRKDAGEEQRVVRAVGNEELVDDGGFVFRRAAAGAAAPDAAAAGGSAARAGARDPAGGEQAADLADVPEAYREALRAVPDDAQGAARVVHLCKSLAAKVRQDVLQYEAQLPDEYYATVKQAYNTVLDAWLAKVEQLAADEQILMPGDIEAGSDVALGDAESRRAMLVGLRDRLLNEEREWQSLKAAAAAQGAVGGAPRPTSLAAGPELKAAVDAALERARARSVAGKLDEALGDALRKLSLQVDALAALVDGAEGLATQAERACALMQSELRGAAFAHLAHVDSPLALIRAAVRGGGAPPREG
ncbi:unnamed protein product [Pedinophyceae sp. YPF-701]|nr:unnamed protein product [Pedinophyceae sp. YPF-701]